MLSALIISVLVFYLRPLCKLHSVVDVQGRWTAFTVDEGSVSSDGTYGWVIKKLSFTWMLDSSFPVRLQWLGT